MDKHTGSVFEKHPRVTLCVIMIALLFALYGLFSVKWINNAYTEHQPKSLKTIIQQYYIGKMIDNNIGRFIKLREYPPNTVRQERPSRNYMKNIAPNTIERKYYKLAIDSDGFIEPSAIHADPEIKIVFLGGSTTECLYMEETERFPYVVGRKLEERLGRKVNTYNGGVSANESKHSLNILMNKVLPLHPDVVVLMHNINDLVVLRSQGTYDHKNSLKSHVQTSKNIFTRYELPPAQTASSSEDLIKLFSRNLKMFIAICRINEIEPILMTQANRVKDDPLYHQFNEVIRNIGKMEQVKVIDLAQEVPQTTEYIYDSYHYTAKGSALAAEIILKELIEDLQKMFYA
jgi:hypothetical protein